MKRCLLIIAAMLLTFSVQCNGVPVDAELELANQASSCGGETLCAL